ncbi:hypothetical protein EGH62_04270 [Klebsiella aerogenes]|uniref:helix-turn-helix domain-containing protein n=1 Tax=Klebsiella aerogenes TaxID=548 RepID=UPI000F7F0407|nr:helix-turn-helix domain-containing protein [Klebsiella aerogenes]RSW87268.1 hypothetical protein EGH62_04270 [Klebsiella aerogenes]
MKKATDFYLYSDDDFDAFIDFIKSQGVQRRYSKGERLNLAKAEVGFVLDGQLGVYYKGNGKFIDNAFYAMPLIMLKNKNITGHPFFYRVESDVVISIMPVSKIFETHNGTRNSHGLVFSSLAYSILEKLAMTYDIRHGGNGYQIVKELIELYNIEPHATQGLANYILNRTQLSNSYVFKILAALREQKYIEMKNARLTKIIKPLPDKI